METYQDFFYKVLLRLPNVRETHTYVVMQEMKPYAPVPFLNPSPSPPGA
jgi:hypothetical protein